MDTTYDTQIEQIVQSIFSSMLGMEVVRNAEGAAACDECVLGTIQITGERSMLEATLDRVAPLIPKQRTMVILNRDHLRLAVPQLAGIPGENVLVQPCNRDTGPEACVQECQ